MSDDEFMELQVFLIKRPNAGTVIPGTGGLRKLRWSLGNKGKRGGMRIIYYWQCSQNQIYLMTLYSKNEKADLSSGEKKDIKRMLDGW